MAYTKFHKNYGDFEIVIPAIDFSELNDDEAKETIEVLRSYENDYVCLNLDDHCHQRKARDAIEAKIGKHDWGLQEYLWENMGKINWPAPLIMHSFGPFQLAGTTLRKEWCNHMANEIEREHFGHADQTT